MPLLCSLTILPITSELFLATQHAPLKAWHGSIGIKFFSILSLMQKAIHDQGSQYHSQFMKELYWLLGIEGNFTTAYHPQTNGQTEWMNQEIEHYLWLFINHHQSNWHEWLPLMEFIYNDWEHSATKVILFYANNGWHPNKGITLRFTSINPYAQELADNMRRIREKVGAALMKDKADWEVRL